MKNLCILITLIFLGCNVNSSVEDSLGNDIGLTHDGGDGLEDQSFSTRDWCWYDNTTHGTIAGNGQSGNCLQWSWLEDATTETLSLFNYEVYEEVASKIDPEVTILKFKYFKCPKCKKHLKFEPKHQSAYTCICGLKMRFLGANVHCIDKQSN